MLKKLALNFCALLALTGCANANSIWRNESMLRNKDGVAITSMDARQRTVIARRDSKRGDREGNDLQYCAEQAPDIFAVLASSLRGDGEIFASPEQNRAKLAVEAAMSESASSISRTQSLNLVTQLLYRTCEAGLNGRLSNLEMASLLRQSQRLVTSMMAIEQLTTLGRPIGSNYLSAGMASVFGDSKAGERLDTVFQNRTAAIAASTSAKEALAKALEKAPAPVAPATTKTCASIASETDKAECVEKEAKFKRAEATEKDVREHYAALSVIAGAGIVAGQTTTAGSSSSGSTTTIDNSSIAIISETVFNLAKLAGSVDEIDTVCQWLTNASGPVNGSIAFPKLWKNCRERSADQEGSLVANTGAQSVQAALNQTPGTALPGSAIGGEFSANKALDPVRPTATQVGDRSVTGRIFIQIADEKQREKLATMPSILRQAFPLARIAQDLDLESTRSPQVTEVRFFDENSRRAAIAVQTVLQSALAKQNAGATVNLGNFSSFGRANNVSPGQIEIWIGSTFAVP